MILLYSLIAIFTAWIWVDYYRLIDIYNKENLWHFILTFLLGGASVFIVLGLNTYVLDHFNFELNGGFLNDIAYCVFKIGMVEELAKCLPFFIIYFVFRNHFVEPIDFLVFISISALGFSAVENTMYFYLHGPGIINGRAILSTVGHMFDTSLIAYGIIRYKYHYKKNRVLWLLLFFFLAALAHGIYDFGLMYEGFSGWGVLITIFYFLFTVSIFAGILNNALNHSSFFSYKKVVNSNKVAGRLLLYYAIIFLIQLVFLSFIRDIQYAILDFRTSIFTSGFIILVTVVRLSRFNLIQNRWNNLKIELPFSFYASDMDGSPRIRMQIRGESFNEAQLCLYYREFFYIHPVSPRNSYLDSPRLAYIDEKLFLKYDEIFYLARVFDEGPEGSFEKMLLKAKSFGNSLAYEKYPIVGLLKMEDINDIENSTRTVKDFDFMEWVYIKSIPSDAQ